MYLLRFPGMGVIQVVKRFVISEIHEKLVKRMELEKGRDITEREKQQVSVLYIIIGRSSST